MTLVFYHLQLFALTHTFLHAIVNFWCSASDFNLSACSIFQDLVSTISFIFGVWFFRDGISLVVLKLFVLVALVGFANLFYFWDLGVEKHLMLEISLKFDEQIWNKNCVFICDVRKEESKMHKIKVKCFLSFSSVVFCFRSVHGLIAEFHLIFQQVQIHHWELMSWFMMDDFVHPLTWMLQHEKWL